MPEQFKTTLEMLNNELASYTWARLTWFKRATEHKTVAVDMESTHDFTMYHLPHTVVVCETLCQMQFGKDLTFGCDDNC